MHDYIKKFVEIVNKYKDSKLFGKFNAFKSYNEYQSMLNSNIALQQMATEPFTIRLLVGIMPDIRDRFNSSKGQSRCITMLEILQIFISKWVENEISRLGKRDKEQLAEEIVDIDPGQLDDNIEEAVDAINSEALHII